MSEPVRSGHAGAAQAPAVAQTHSATVFFLGERAYKVKRPVNLGFLDFSTPSARRSACHTEVELNRRLAPDVYLGVAEIWDWHGQPCDWMVVMRRMPDERRLAKLVRDGHQVGEQLRAVARLLASFHATAGRDDRIDRAGSPEALRSRWLANLSELRPFHADPLTPALIEEITERALRYIDGRTALLRARIEAGLIRDGHGDLLADDIFCLPDGPRVLDCLEFDDALRWMDGLDDAALLAMDLERLGAPQLAQTFLDGYAEFTGTPRVPSLEHHYIAYRALMRAKVACVRYSQGVQESGDEARQLARIAVAHLRAGEPRMIVVGGLPGTGKSTVAGAVADRLGASLLRSDRVRKEAAGLAPEQDAAAGWQRGIYTRSASRRTYDLLVERSRLLLARGESVVLDASWQHDADRRRARVAAADCGSLLTELRCVTAPEVAQQRLRRRSGDVSDATPAVAQRMAEGFAPWPEAVEVDTTGSIDATVAHAMRAVAGAFDPR